METQAILQRLYAVSARKRPRRHWVRWLRGVVLGWAQRNTTRLVIGGSLLAVWITSHIYYYNTLVDLDFNVAAARAQIGAVQQKRNHIQRNLTQLVRYYASYERGLMNELTTLRTNKKEPLETASIQQLLAHLSAVAEQYPALNLNKSVEQLSEAITTTESEIASRIVEYNSAVNTYTTALNQFPANIFGRLLGFQNRDFYEPEDRSVLDYKVVEP